MPNHTGARLVIDACTEVRHEGAEAGDGDTGGRALGSKRLRSQSEGANCLACVVLPGGVEDLDGSGDGLVQGKIHLSLPQFTPELAGVVAADAASLRCELERLQHRELLGGVARAEEAAKARELVDDGVHRLARVKGQRKEEVFELVCSHALPRVLCGVVHENVFHHKLPHLPRAVRFAVGRHLRLNDADGARAELLDTEHALGALLAPLPKFPVRHADRRLPHRGDRKLGRGLGHDILGDTGEF
mmetsp:Transcript_42176/g.134895  ORF Transcript_42176/g.134895 Transcript_42176/m.134895 type:complete len:245 (+) Transcript_42176:1294-2028(+)